MNLLVGLAVDDIASVMRVATVKRLEMRVKLTLDVEKQLKLLWFFKSIRRFRKMNYQVPLWQKILKKVFRIQMQTQFKKNFTRLENYGLIQTAKNPDQKTSTSTNITNIPKIDEKTTGTSGSGISPDWITTVHTQINTKYNEFNRHMIELKEQQEKINKILQQFPTTTSRQTSHTTLAPTTA